MQLGYFSVQKCSYRNCSAVISKTITFINIPRPGEIHVSIAIKIFESIFTLINRCFSKRDHPRPREARNEPMLQVVRLVIFYNGRRNFNLATRWSKFREGARSPLLYCCSIFKPILRLWTTLLGSRGLKDARYVSTGNGPIKKTMTKRVWSTTRLNELIRFCIADVLVVKEDTVNEEHWLGCFERNTKNCYPTLSIWFVPASAHSP